MSLIRSNPKCAKREFKRRCSKYSLLPPRFRHEQDLAQYKSLNFQHHFPCFLLFFAAFLHGCFLAYPVAKVLIYHLPSSWLRCRRKRASLKVSTSGEHPIQYLQKKYSQRARSILFWVSLRTAQSSFSHNMDPTGLNHRQRLRESRFSSLRSPML